MAVVVVGRKTLVFFCIVLTTFVHVRSEPERSEPVLVIFENVEASEKELLWLNGPSGIALLSVIPGRSAQEVLTFVGHELGWRRSKTTGLGLGLEGQFVVETTTRTVGLSALASSRRDDFDDEVAAVDAALRRRDVDVFADLKNASRFAYYVVDVPSVEAFVASLRRRNLRSTFRNVAERATTFGSNRFLEAIAFEVDDCFVLARRRQERTDGSTESRLYVDVESDRKRWLPLSLNDVVPSPADLRDLLSVDVEVEAKEEPDFLFFRRRRRRRKNVLAVGCSPEASLLAVRRRDVAVLHCLDADAAKRRRAVFDAKANGAKLVALSNTRNTLRKYDLILVKVLLDDDGGGEQTAGAVVQSNKYVANNDDNNREAEEPLSTARVFHHLSSSSRDQAAATTSAGTTRAFLNESHHFLHDDGLLLVRGSHLHAVKHHLDTQNFLHCEKFPDAKAEDIPTSLRCRKPPHVHRSTQWGRRRPRRQHHDPQHHDPQLPFDPASL